MSGSLGGEHGAVVHLRGGRTKDGLAVACLFVIAVLPSLLLWENSYVLIHDNLDSDFVYLTNLVRTGTAFEYGTGAVLPSVMDGLPRDALRSGLNVTVVLFSVLDPLAAYIVNSILVRGVAFVGMLLLLRHHVLPDEAERGSSRWLALTFALLPFYSLYGLSVAGQPLLLFSYANIVKGRGRWWDWLTVGAFPLYSALYMGGIPVLMGLVAYTLVRAVGQRRMEWSVLAPILLLGAGYLVVEWPMIESAYFDASWTSHRVEFDRSAPLSGIPGSALSLLAFGHYHAATMPTFVIALALALSSKDIWRSAWRRATIHLLLAVAAIVLVEALYVPLVIRYLGDVLPILEQVQLHRLYLLLPLCWFMLFGLALATMKVRTELRRIVQSLIVLQACVVVYFSTEVRNNLALLLGREVEPTFTEFFAPALFGSIQDQIGMTPSSYRVVGVGLHPSILQYNGFYTLDSYQNHYPLAYKHRFARVIAPELRKDPGLERYFRDWGNRCYVFSSELGTNFLWSKDSAKTIEQLSLDVRALEQMGGRYVLSSVPIGNHGALGLQLLGTFETPRSYWRIHLYGLRA